MHVQYILSAVGNEPSTQSKAWNEIPRWRVKFY